MCAPQLLRPSDRKRRSILGFWRGLPPLGVEPLHEGVHLIEHRIECRVLRQDGHAEVPCAGDLLEAGAGHADDASCFEQVQAPELVGGRSLGDRREIGRR